MTVEKLATTAETHMHLANTILKNEPEALEPQLLSKQVTPYQPYTLGPNDMLPKFRRWDRIRYGIRRHFKRP